MRSQLPNFIIATAFLVPHVAHADFPPEWDRRQSQEHGWIYDDFETGVARSKETGKPMLVVLRCPP